MHSWEHDRNGINASILLKGVADDFTLKDGLEVITDSFSALGIKRTKRLSVQVPMPPMRSEKHKHSIRYYQSLVKRFNNIMGIQ